MTRKIKVVVIEAGPDYTDRVDVFFADVDAGAGEALALAAAIDAVTERGHQVLYDHQGGLCIYVDSAEDEPFFAVTTRPR